MIMKSKNLILGLAVIVAAFSSCKNENETRAEETVDRYESYVDSLSNVAAADAKANWQAIEAAYQQRTSEAEAALENAKDRAKAEERLAESRAKYDAWKVRVQDEMNAEANRGGQQLRDSMFGPGKVASGDMSFSWVNKDNILQVYQNFYDTYSANKDNYSREELDEIKLLYEALDTRKNTVEKEGLSAEDNRKIAALKVKFAPSFKWERITSKAEENDAAK